MSFSLINFWSKYLSTNNISFFFLLAITKLNLARQQLCTMQQQRNGSIVIFLLLLDIFKLKYFHVFMWHDLKDNWLCTTEENATWTKIVELNSNTFSTSFGDGDFATMFVLRYKWQTLTKLWVWRCEWEIFFLFQKFSLAERKILKLFRIIAKYFL